MTPDIVCLAKALGGGLPCGAIGGHGRGHAHRRGRHVRAGRHVQRQPADDGRGQGHAARGAHARRPTRTSTTCGTAWPTGSDDILGPARHRGLRQRVRRQGVRRLLRRAASATTATSGATTAATATRTGSTSTTVACSCRRGASASSGRCRSSTPTTTSTSSWPTSETFATALTAADRWCRTGDDPRRPGQGRAPGPWPSWRHRDWDAVVVGGGHNGLTAAAYLAKAGKSVLVLEARDRLGGACTLEQPVRRRRLHGQPVRLRRRPARPAGHRRAPPPATTATRCSSPSPFIWCPFDDGT